MSKVEVLHERFPYRYVQSGTIELNLNRTYFIMKTEVLLERYPYRYVQSGTIELNGRPDYRIQKFDEWTKRYKDMYLLDNSIQLDYAMEDFEYTKWLDPDRVPCYVRDRVKP